METIFICLNALYYSDCSQIESLTAELQDLALPEALWVFVCLCGYPTAFSRSLFQVETFNWFETATIRIGKNSKSESGLNEFEIETFICQCNKLKGDKLIFKFENDLVLFRKRF